LDLSDRLSRLRERLGIVQSYRRVFDTPDGKRVLHHLMKEGFITRSTFVAGSEHETALNEGTRRMVLSILRMAYKNESTLLQEIEQVQQQEERR
jgi:hypothetical protein